jgi:glycolate oxidase FAD binding subunit
LQIGSDLVEHEPGDLTCIVEAGMRLSALQAALGAHGQRLSLDPPGDPTVGEIVDGNLSGPRRHRFGTPRDLVIGMTVVLADGTVASSGGKVVKNVAGYDLGKLFCGAGGAFGQVARVAFRLHPKPAASATLVVPFETPAEGARLARAVLHSQVTPYALDLLVLRVPEGHPNDARKTADSGQRLALLFEGGAQAVAAQVETARALLGGSTDDSVWDAIAARQAAARGHVHFRKLEAFLEQTPEAVVRVGSLTAYVPDAVAPTPSPLVERIRAELAG